MEKISQGLVTVDQQVAELKRNFEVLMKEAATIKVDLEKEQDVIRVSCVSDWVESGFRCAYMFQRLHISHLRDSGLIFVCRLDLIKDKHATYLSCQVAGTLVERLGGEFERWNQQIVVLEKELNQVHFPRLFFPWRIIF